MVAVIGQWRFRKITAQDGEYSQYKCARGDQFYHVSLFVRCVQKVSCGGEKYALCMRRWIFMVIGLILRADL
jgi:hypothetical protein